MAIQTKKLKKSLSDVNMPQCKFCDKTFTREKTLVAHLCIKKQRFNDKNTIGSRLGFMAYRKFYELSSNSKSPKTFDDFIGSSYYNDFIKYGRYLCDLNPIDKEQYTIYIIRNSKKMQDWVKPQTYKDFLINFLQKESVDSAIERSILTITDWAEKNNKQLGDFFASGSIFEIAYLISVGQVSPWLLYYSKHSQRVFDELSDEQAILICDIINPELWSVIIAKNKNDSDFVKQIVSEADL